MDRLTQLDFAALAGLSPIALMLVDESGLVLFVNSAASGLLARQSILVLRDGSLHARRTGEDRELREALSAPAGGHRATTLCFHSREGFPVIVADLHRIRAGVIAVRVTQMQAPAAPSRERLRILFGLTPAESRVAIAMLGGQGLTAIAQEHGVEAETVRSQAKRIRSKAGARSQNQLLGILAAAGPGFTG